MNPDLEKRISDLEKTVNNLMSSSMFPLEVQNSILQRIGSLSATGLGIAGTPSVETAFPFAVPANPSGTLAVVYKGQTFNLLYK
jgi:hypothetical protein